MAVVSVVLTICLVLGFIETNKQKPKKTKKNQTLSCVYLQLTYGLLFKNQHLLNEGTKSRQISHSPNSVTYRKMTINQ